MVFPEMFHQIQPDEIIIEEDGVGGNERME